MVVLCEIAQGDQYCMTKSADQKAQIRRAFVSLAGLICVVWYLRRKYTYCKYYLNFTTETHKLRVSQSCFFFFIDFMVDSAVLLIGSKHYSNTNDNR